MHPGLSACGLTVVKNWPHTNHCGVQYISAVSAKWAIPPGFGIIKTPQDMYSVRANHERCVAVYKTEGVYLCNHIAELYLLFLTLTGGNYQSSLVFRQDGD